MELGDLPNSDLISLQKCDGDENPKSDDRRVKVCPVSA